MFRLPTADHPARALMGEASAVAETLNPARAAELPAVWQARKSAEAAFAADSAIRRICYIVMRADTGERWLISFGRRGGWRKEWNFGAGH